MIVTVTPNPSLDRTLDVEQLRRGEVLRATGVRVDPGGKGINVALALRAVGRDSVAVLPVGGREGEQLTDALEQAGIRIVEVPVDGSVRTNLSLAEPDGTVTKINAPGPTLDPSDLAALTAAVMGAAGVGDWVAGCGSLPPGVPTSWYAELVTAAHGAGARVVIDASGPALTAAVAVGPDLIKPNVHELAELTGRSLVRLGEVVDAAEQVRASGVARVVVSLGADGAVLVDDNGAWHATTPPITVRSAVGAGDALVAGLLDADARGPDALARGVAFGVGAARLPGTQFPSSSELDLDAVTVAEVDPDRALTEPARTEPARTEPARTEPGGTR